MRAYLTLRRAHYVGVLTCLSLLAGGCSMFSGEATVHKDAKGSVYLKQVADWSFEASHPAMIDPMTMLKVVKGVVTDSALQMPASGSKPMRVFSDEDAVFLAPLLAQSLSQAKPDQIVGFKVSSSAGSGAEPTAGTLYLRNGSLHLTIAPSTDNRASGFVPNSVARLEKAPSFVAMGSRAVTMIIDQQALAKVPEPTVEPAAIAGRTVPEPELMAAGQDLHANGSLYGEFTELNGDELLNKKLDELRDARAANKMKDSEIATLKKEAARMKKELRQRAEEVKALKATKASAKPAQKKKSAEARKVR